MLGFITHLECSACGEKLNADQLQNLCTACQSPLLARYDLSAIESAITPALIESRPSGVWRWRELLPVRNRRFEVSLGEGDTPLLHVPRLGQRVGLDQLYIKDEGPNATGSFKARGMTAAVSRAWELGAHALVAPTAGNAGGALAAYAARAGLEAHVFMPKDAPMPNQIECQLYGAQLILVNGLINDAAKQAAAEAVKHGWFEVATLKEPYRIEGKKTMGLELAVHFKDADGKWNLPDVVLYPTGGGVGLIGMWKAFHELEALGWIGSKRPRFVAVQAAGCQPIVKAFNQGAIAAEVYANAATIASGLRVPSVRGDRLILRALKETNGTAIAVSDDDILEAQWLIARLAGVFTAPEGAACFSAVTQLVESGWIKPDERVVMFNTGSGYKYTELLPKPTN